jgi:hypothetical protein
MTPFPRSFIPQQTVYVSAFLAADEMRNCQVSQKQYPEYHHQHRIQDQPLLGKACDKAKETSQAPMIPSSFTNFSLGKDKNTKW